MIHLLSITLESCQYSTKLTTKLTSLDTENTLDFVLINKAIYWAKSYHHGQCRKSGEPFYSHPLAVAFMISDYMLKNNTIVASILHDIVEDTEVTIAMVVDTFGWRIAEMVDRLTRDRPNGVKLSVEEILINAYHQQDKEVLMIKIVDRIHNLHTIQCFNRNKQIKIKQQTLIDFLPLVLRMEQHENFDTILSLCIKEKEHPIFQDILSLESIELNQSISQFNHIRYRDY